MSIVLRYNMHGLPSPSAPFHGRDAVHGGRAMRWTCDAVHVQSVSNV